MEQDRLAARKLSKRDRALVEHVARYRLTTREVVHSLFLPEAHINAATKVLLRLTASGVLAKHPLCGTRDYWTLSPALAQLLGRRSTWGTALAYEGLIRHYGVLAFCHGGKIRRELLTQAEFVARFPDHDDSSLLGHPYYVDQVAGHDCLGLILVNDLEDHLRIVKKCRRVIHRRLENAGFRRTINAGRFVVAIVTAFPEKKAKLEEALGEAELRSVQFRVTVRSDLAALQVGNATRRKRQPTTA